MKIFVFGNDIVTNDSIPLTLIPKLSERFPKIDFIHVDPTENWYQEEQELVILDTVVGIEKVTIFHSLDEFEKQARVTPHDYDVYMDMQLLIKMGKVKKITIIGTPQELKKQTVKETSQILSTLLLGSL